MVIFHQGAKVLIESEIQTRTVVCKSSYWLQVNKLLRRKGLYNLLTVSYKRNVLLCVPSARSLLQKYDINAVLCEGITTKKILKYFTFSFIINRIFPSPYGCYTECCFSVSVVWVEIWVNSVQRSVLWTNEDGQSLRWRPLAQEHQQTHMPTM